MLTYTQLYQQFLNCIREAINQYQSLFTVSTMSIERAAEISQIQFILSQANDVEKLKIDLINVISQLKTGWLIFKTGNSRLKSMLEIHLYDPMYSQEAFFKSRIFELEQEMQNFKKPPATSLLINDVQEENYNNATHGFSNQERDYFYQRIKKLEKYNHDLENKNKQLQEKIEHLTLINHRLSSDDKTKRGTDYFSTFGYTSTNAHEDILLDFKISPIEEDINLSPGSSLGRSLQLQTVSLPKK